MSFHLEEKKRKKTRVQGSGAIPSMYWPRLKRVHSITGCEAPVLCRLCNRSNLSCFTMSKAKTEEHQGPLHVVPPGLALPSTGPHPGARPGVGARRRAPGGRVFAHGTRPGSARNGDVGPPSSRLTHHPAGRSMRGRCNVVWVAVVAWGQGRFRRPNPWTKTLAIGTWNVTSLGGKEPELVREVERYRLEIVGLASTHDSLGSAQGERRRAGVGLLIAPQLSRHVLEFTPVNERVASLRLRVGDRSLAVVCAYTGRTAVQSTRPSWSPWEGYLIVLRLGTPLFYWGTSTLTWATTVIPGGA
ncbi:hypothetical protein L3Q82_000536 [Scortum barcoo]|uniref:Uncharacterized protein n=1 Tax=Scortum barcoo TaxID=214431 RepID=A0ACB8WEW2_9TELE|nr:hypothetical protein L3Q82_000536 [Scortum barcoo]